MEYSLKVDNCFHLLIPFNLKGKHAMELSAKRDQIRMKYNPLVALPKLENETDVEWSNRYLKSINKDPQRKDESDEDFLKRTFESTDSKDEFRKLYDYIKAIAAMFNQTIEDDFDKFLLNMDIDAVNSFLYNIFKKCRIPTAEFE